MPRLQTTQKTMAVLTPCYWYEALSDWKLSETENEKLTSGYHAITSGVVDYLKRTKP